MKNLKNILIILITIFLIQDCTDDSNSDITIKKIKKENIKASKNKNLNSGKAAETQIEENSNKERDENETEPENENDEDLEEGNPKEEEIQTQEGDKEDKQNLETPQKQEKPQPKKDYDKVYIKGNYIYHKIGNNIIAHPVAGKLWKQIQKKYNNGNPIKFEDKKATKFSDKLNKQEDIEVPKENCYINSGTKEEGIISTINNDLNDKFPEGSFEEIPENILKNEKEILGYIFQHYNIEFAEKFKSYEMEFESVDGKKQKIEAIFAKGNYPSYNYPGDKASNYVKILDYDISYLVKEEYYLLKLLPKNKDIMIVIGKGSRYSTPEKLQKAILDLKEKNKLRGRDIYREIFIMPKIIFNLKGGEYDPLVKKEFINSGFINKAKSFISNFIGKAEKHLISKISDNIKFQLTESEGIGNDSPIRLHCPSNCKGKKFAYFKKHFSPITNFSITVMDKENLDILLYLNINDYKDFMIPIS